MHILVMIFSYFTFFILPKLIKKNSWRLLVALAIAAGGCAIFLIYFPQQAKRPLLYFFVAVQLLAVGIRYLAENHGEVDVLASFKRKE